MFGAIIGDMVGSIYEFNNHKSKDFPLFSAGCFPTDDTFMTIAIGKVFTELPENIHMLPNKARDYMQMVGQHFPDCGFGSRFYDWIFTDDPKPYNSFGNGAAMRVSACGWAARSLREAKIFADIVTGVSHDHPEGFKGAESVACAIFLAKSGKSKDEIRDYIQANYYDLSFTLDEIRPTYTFDESCQGTVPQAIEAFLESTDFEDAIRNAISIGGDSDTIAAITGSIAEAYYGVPQQLVNEMLLCYLRSIEYPTGRYIVASPMALEMLKWVFQFENKYCLRGGNK